MKQYLDYLADVYSSGLTKSDRTNTGTISVFGRQLRFDLTEGFPLMTTKNVPFRLVAHELLWFLAGDTNIKYLKDNNVNIWDEWADTQGNLGPVYGAQWRSWTAPNDQVIDQIADVHKQLKTNPDSRRMAVSAWNPADVPKMALPPCHALFQFYTRELEIEERSYFYAKKTGIHYDLRNVDPTRIFDNACIPKRYLDCQLYQRSADSFLGIPFNIASYALLTHIMAHSVGMMPGEFVWTGGDCHIYSNHYDQVEQQLSRTPTQLPTLEILGEPKLPWEYTIADFKLTNYTPQAAIKAPIAV